MSDSHYYRDGDRGGGPSSYSCLRCKKKFSTMTAMIIHSHKHTNCAAHGRGGNGTGSSRESPSRNASGGAELADLDPLARLPNVSGSDGRCHRSKSNRSGYISPDSHKDERIGNSSNTESLSNHSSVFRNLSTLVELPRLSGPHENTIPPGAQTDTQVPPRYGCEQCDKTFSRSDNLKRHIWSKHSDRLQYQCDICHTYFVRQDSVRRHKMKMHSENGALKCRKCEKQFTRTDSLRKHMQRKHEEIRKYPCRECDEEFISMKQRAEHVVNVHEKESGYGCKKEPEYECKYCGRAFARDSTVRSHIHRTHGKKTTSVNDYNHRRK